MTTAYAKKKKQATASKPTAKRERTAQRLHQEIVPALARPPSAAAQRLAARAKAFAEADDAALAVQKLDELAAMVAYARAEVLAGRAKPADVIDVAATAYRSFAGEKSDSPTAIAARVMQVIDHVMGLICEAKLPGPSANQAAWAVIEAGNLLGSYLPIIRLEIGEFYPEHARRLTDDGITQLIEAHIQLQGERGIGKWDELAALCKTELRITVKPDQARDAVRIRKNTG